MSMPTSATEIAAAIVRGETSASAVLEDCLSRIDAADPQLNCFTAVLAEDARAAAAAVDADIAAGRPIGPLAGVPVAVKNLFDVAGQVTIAGSRLLRGNPPAAQDATAVARLRAAGAVLVGLLNMDEFAYGFSTENAHDGPTHNPHDPARIAGGSSGGSAAAVAAGLVPLTLGSDTNGSIRVPAALTGVFGLMPTFGRLSRAGTFPFVADLDRIGPFARSARDLAAAYDALQGADPRDPMLAPVAAEPAGRGVEGDDLAGLRVGVLQGFFRQGGTAEAFAAVDSIAAALPGARPVELPLAAAARAAAFVLTAAQGGALHLERLRADAEGFDPAVRDRLIAGLMVPGGALVQAQRLRAAFRAQAQALFREVDVLLAPATPMSAPRIGEAVVEIDGKPVPVRANLGCYTQAIGYIGLPVVTLPVTAPGVLPLGVQLIGPAFSEARLLHIAHRLELAGAARAQAPDTLPFHRAA